MKILICDDEPLARNRLSRLISKIEGHDVVAQAQNGFEALEMTQRFSPDSLIIDVQMPGISGIETATHIAKLENPPAIVFSTASAEHAMDALNVSAIAYLLKPVKLEKLAAALKSCQKVNRAQLQTLKTEKNSTPSTDTSPRGASEQKYISAKTHKGMELIPIEDIIYLKADQKYISIYHQGGEVLVDDSLKELETELGDHFVRIHRNALVARSHIRRMETTSSGVNLVYLNDVESPLRASRRHLKLLRSVLAEHQHSQ